MNNSCRNVISLSNQILVLFTVIIGITCSATQAKVVPAVVHHSSSSNASKIVSFTSDMILSKQGLLDVNETIDIDFAQTPRHGIYRFVPIRFHRGAGIYTTHLRMLSVTDAIGQPYHYQSSNIGSDLTVKIGESNRVVIGRQTYKLHYQVTKAINFFQKEPELYWNVTGDQSQYTIESATALVHLPITDASATKLEAFVGPPGSTKTVPIVARGNTVTVHSGVLLPGEGLTFAIRMPVGTVILPTVSNEIIWFVQDWREAFLLPLITAAMLWIYWWFFGKDKGAHKAIGVEWEPPKDLTPAEVGTLIDEKCDVADITSTLVDLAARGYLKIEQIPYDGILMMSKKDYRFTELTVPAGAEPLKLHESLMLNAVFGYSSRENYLSSLKGKFSSSIPEITDAVYDSLLIKKYFARDPNTDRSTFVSFGILIMIVGIISMIVGGNDLFAASIGVIISGAIVGVASNTMPARTAAGGAALNQCLAFQRFVKTTEKKRIEVLVKDDPTIFGRLLPYAMVLGCADQWSTAFKDLMAAPPDWYSSSDVSDLTTYTFSRDLSDGLNTISQVFASPALPGSSNSSGGGGGGWGGGGSGGAGDGLSGFADGLGAVAGGFGGGGVSSW
jgi:uncharacterized membrane protein